MNVDDYMLDEENIPVYRSDDRLVERLKSGVSLQEFFSYTDEQILDLYVIALRLFDQKQFLKASQALTFLTHLKPMVSDFWMARGRSYLELDSQDRAMQCFLKGMEVRPDLFESYLPALGLFIEQRNLSKARELVEVALKVAAEMTDVAASESLKSEANEALTAIAKRNR